MSRIENPRVINGLRDHIGNPEWNVGKDRGSAVWGFNVNLR